MSYENEKRLVNACVGAIILIALTSVAAFITHIVWWINLMMDGSMEVWQGVLAVLGTLVPFIGAIHGFILWFS